MKRAFTGFSIFTFMCTFIIFLPLRSPAEEYKYFGGGKRDPFMPLITSEIKTSLGLQVVESIEDVSFEGVMFDPLGTSMAMLNGEVVKAGDKAYNVEVLEIYENALTIKIYDKTYTIDLIEEGGGAGEI